MNIRGALLRGREGPKYIGLSTRGSTCYLNSVLQVFFMTKEFRDAVQSSESSHTSYIDAQLKDLFLLLKKGCPTTEDIIHGLGIKDVWKQQDAAEYFERILSLASPEASQVFHGKLNHRMSCLCGKSTDEHNSFWTLNLPINNAHNGVYNVEDGLKRFFSQSKLTGENQVYCDGCEAKADTTTECEVELYPKVLVLLLKRFEFKYYKMDYVKNNCPVDVPLNIEMPMGVSYELYATVDHVGDLRGGHYTATIQPPDDGGCWYDFNDSRVTPKTHFNPKKSQSGYLLFYRKRERQMSEPPLEDPSRPLDEQQVREGRGDVTGGDDVRVLVDVPGCGKVTGGDVVVVGDSQPIETVRFVRKGSERIKTNPVSRDFMLMPTNVNLLNRVPEQDCPTLFVRHRTKCKPMHSEW
uniref:Ubiquitin carboxyl-terminal hydrolase n=1 Tax=Gadus morhua TaxID=8049 RepID=A0A8C5CMK4_GADMO